MNYGRLINMDIFTDAYRITGKVTVRSTGLLGELGDQNSDYLDLQEAYISRVQHPGEIIASYNLGSFRKDNINFIILQDRREGIPVGSSHAASIFARGRPIPAFITVPSFEIRGEIMYESKITPGAVLGHTLVRFQPVFSAEASASLYPDISYSGDLILVHKERIGILCMGNEA